MPKPRKSYWNTRLGKWVSDYGVSALVRDLSSAGEPIHYNTVYRWLTGSVYVRPSIALKLVRLSDQKISLEDIYSQRASVGADPPEPVFLPVVPRELSR